MSVERVYRVVPSRGRPHRLTCTREYAHDLARALAASDRAGVAVCEVYPSGIVQVREVLSPPRARRPGSPGVVEDPFGTAT